MPEYAAAQYLDGHEGMFKVGFEPGFLTSTATAVTALPAMSTVGYASAPTITLNENPVEIPGVGSDETFGDVEMRREVSASGSLLVSGGVQARRFLHAIHRKRGSSGIPDASHFTCVPVLSLLGAAANECDTTRGVAWACRFGFLSSLEETLSMGELARMQFEAQFLTSTELARQAPPTRDEIMTAGGRPFTLYDASLLYNDGTANIDLQPILESITLRSQRNIKRRGIRKAPGTALERTPRILLPGAIRHTIDLGLSDPIPAIPAALSLVYDNGTEQITRTYSNLTPNTYAMQGPEAEGEFAFSLSLKAATVAIL